MTNKNAPKSSKKIQVPQKAKSDNDLLNYAKANEQLLSEIQGKLARSAVLNGGFDNLVTTIEKINDKQEELITKVNDIHAGLYSPNEGLYARVRSIEDTKDIKPQYAQDLEKKTLELEIWRENSEKHLEITEAIIKEEKKETSEQLEQLEELIKLKNKVAGVFKWFLIASGGALISMGFKLLYDIVSKFSS